MIALRFFRLIPAWVSLCMIAISPAIGDVIVHPATTEKTISKAKLRQIFNLRVTKWPDGTPIRVFVLNREHSAHITFCHEKLGIYPHQLQQTLDRAAFSGIPVPSEFQSEDEMLKAVASTPGAIGYVRKKPRSTENVNVLQIK